MVCARQSEVATAISGGFTTDDGGWYQPFRLDSGKTVTVHMPEPPGHGSRYVLELHTPGWWQVQRPGEAEAA